MKKLRVCSLLITGAALIFGLATAQAQPYTYFDVADGTYGTPPANTYNTSTGSTTDWIGTVDGTPQWRFRNTGPGVPAWGTSAYDGRFVGPDPALYTLLSGLQASTEYQVRVYGVYPRAVTNVSNIPRYGAEFSTDAGSTWWDVDSHMAGSYTWVDNSSDVGTVLPAPGTGDTRFFTQLLVPVMTDASGGARIDIRIPQYLSDNTLQDRFIIDGYAVMIPEPSFLALAGLSIVALLTLRRR